MDVDMQAEVVASASSQAFLQAGGNARVERYFDPSDAQLYFGAGDLPSSPAFTVVERVGFPEYPDELTIQQNLTLIQSGYFHVGEDPKAFAYQPITGDYSAERWLQLRIQPPFNSVAGLRVWCPNRYQVKPGWVLKFGLAEEFHAPGSDNLESLYATQVMPAGDPGVENPNLITAPIVGGLEDGASPYLVLQLVIDASQAKQQPIGYLSESWTPAPLKLQFAWTET